MENPLDWTDRSNHPEKKLDRQVQLADARAMNAARKPESRALTTRGAATRARIVEAAAELIYTKGADRTSLD